MKRTQILTVILLITILATTLASCGHTHQFDDWQVVKSATCTESGEQERYCDCGEKQTQPIASTGHNFGEWQIIKATTCTESGEQERYCDCGEKQHQVVSAGHLWSEATCTAPKTCQRCALIEGTALGHTTTTGYCSQCGEKISPKIELPDLPLTVSSYGAAIKITEISCEIDWYYKNIVCTLSGERTSGSHSMTCSYSYKLYDSEGFVVASGKGYIGDISVGDKFRNEEFTIFLDEIDTSYTLVIQDD